MVTQVILLIPRCWEVVASVWVPIVAREGSYTTWGLVWRELLTVGVKRALTPFSTNVGASEMAGNVTVFAWMPTVVVKVVGIKMSSDWHGVSAVESF